MDLWSALERMDLWQDWPSAFLDYISVFAVIICPRIVDYLSQ